MKVGGRIATNVPKIPSPASNQGRNLIFMDHQKKEVPNSMAPKVVVTPPLLL